MKRLIAFFYITAAITAVSCKKNEHGHPMAGFNVANAVVGGTTVKVNTNSISLVSPYNGGQYAIRPGAAITITPNGSSTPWYNDPKPATVASKSYTLFLCGQAPTIESIFKEEAYPAPYLDSIMGVRVINLSPNSTPVNITQASNSGVNLFGNVAAKGYVPKALSPVVVPCKPFMMMVIFLKRCNAMETVGYIHSGFTGSV